MNKTNNSTLSSTELTSLMSARKAEVERLTESAGTKLQFIHFDTHNTQKSGDLSGTNGLTGRLFWRIPAPKDVFLHLSCPDVQTTLLRKDLEKFTNYAAKKNLLNKQGSASLANAVKKLRLAEEFSILAYLTARQRDPVKQKKIYIELRNRIQAKIQELKVGESLMIPWGNISGNPDNPDTAASGHIVAMQLKKTTQHELELALFNTGQGINTLKAKDTWMHQPQKPPKENSNLQRYQPTVFSMSAHYVGRVPLIWTDIFKATFSPTINALYTAIYQNREDFIKKPDVKEYPFYRQQGMVGNCAKKSIQVWLHNELRGHEDIYQKFRVHRLYTASQDTLKALRNGPIRFTHSSVRWGGTIKSKSMKARLVNWTSRLGARLHGNGSLLQITMDKSAVAKLTNRARLVSLARFKKTTYSNNDAWAQLKLKL